MSVPISGSGGGPVSRTVSGVKSDDHANVDQVRDSFVHLKY